MGPSAIARAAMARLGLRPSLIDLTYEVSWRCNLACSYCDRHTPMPNEMTREQIFAVLREFCELGMIRIHLDGGEPLMHRLIGQMVDWLTDHGVVVSMNTNGALVPRRCDVVRKLSKIHISLDGPSECHDARAGQLRAGHRRSEGGATRRRRGRVPLHRRTAQRRVDRDAARDR